MTRPRTAVGRHVAMRLIVGLAVAVCFAAPTALVEAQQPATQPEDTTVSAPTTATPSETTAPTAPTETTAAPESTSGESDGTSTLSVVGVVIGVIGIALLLGLAAWWMVRRDDPDDAPHPPDSSPYSDLI